MATANPHFDLQHQALSSLRQVHRICLALEIAQVLAGALVLALGYFASAPSTTRLIHLYAALLYFFLAVFAHVVTYYVLLAMGRNVRSAHAANPGSVNAWLVTATATLKRKLVPVFAVHAATLAFATATARLWGTEPNPLHHVAAWSSLAAALAAAAGVAVALRRNSEYLASFVTTGGFDHLPRRNI